MERRKVEVRWRLELERGGGMEKEQSKEETRLRWASRKVSICGLALCCKLAHQRRASAAPCCLVAKGGVMSLTTPLLMTHLKVRVIPPQNVTGLRGYLDHPSLALAGIHCFFR